MKTSKFSFFCGFGLLGLLMFFLHLPFAQAEVCPAIGHPKDFTALLADPYDTQPANGRTPLILVHGIDGNKFPGGADNIGNPYWDYWLNFRMFFNFWGTSGYSLLKEDFKLYSVANYDLYMTQAKLVFIIIKSLTYD